MITKRRLLSTLILFALLLWFTPAWPGWRDSAEFVLCAFFLDIAHPAGYPLYGQLGNAFALVPLGSIAWRTNLFSTFTAAATLVLVYAICRRMLADDFKIDRRAAALLAAIPSFLLINAPHYLKQAFLAEGYVLHAAALLLLVLLYQQFLRTRDRRLLLAAAFLAGLNLGNHASSGIVYGGVLLVLCADWRDLKAVFLPAVLFGLLGLSVYAYLPVRAAAHPPLNTGAPVTARRFLDHITNARDRALRTDGAAESAAPRSVTPLRATLRNDLAKLRSELSLPAMLAAAAGALCLLAFNARLAAVLLVVFVATAGFFKGWPPDPWGPMFFSCGLFAAALGGGVLSRLRLRRQLPAAVVLLTALVWSAAQDPRPGLRQIAEFQLPTDAAEALVRQAPYNAAVISEDSWFLVKYLHDIEGFRDDLVVTYQEGIAYPRYFNPERISRVDGATYTSAADRGAVLELRAFVEFASAAAALVIEPTPALSRFLAPVMRFTQSGTILLEAGRPSALEGAYLGRLRSALAAIGRTVRDLWPPLRRETSHYFNLRLLHVADALTQAGYREAAAGLLNELCGAAPDTAPQDQNDAVPEACSVESLNNLAVLWIDLGRQVEAVRLLHRLLREYPNRAPELQQNLRAAWAGIDAPRRDELRKELDLHWLQ